MSDSVAVGRLVHVTTPRDILTKESDLVGLAHFDAHMSRGNRVASESEILTARLIDRPVRPLFPDGMFNEVQIMAIVLSSDGENDPDVLAVIGASAALSISDGFVPRAPLNIAAPRSSSIISMASCLVWGPCFPHQAALSR
jgi:hypothetical protein